MTEGCTEEDSNASRVLSRRRVVYRSRVDNGGVVDTVITGAEAGEALPRDVVLPREVDDTRPSARQTEQDRWLQDNVPPHW